VYMCEPNLFSGPSETPFSVTMLRNYQPAMDLWRIMPMPDRFFRGPESQPQRVRGIVQRHATVGVLDAHARDTARPSMIELAEGIQ